MSPILTVKRLYISAILFFLIVKDLYCGLIKREKTDSSCINRIYYHFSKFLQNTYSLRFLFQNFSSNIKSIIPKSPNKCLILGNGPSLNVDIQDSLKYVEDCDCLCVNNFANNELFEKLKPCYYVISDPIYWKIDSPEAFKDVRSNLFESIKEKTAWDMYIIVPSEAIIFFENNLSGNKSIKIVGYNSKFSSLDIEERVLYKLFQLNLLMPQPQNVLIPSIFLTLNIGYKNIIILGADHSWHQTLTVDNNNSISFQYTHFYDPCPTPKKFGEDSTVWTIDKIFLAFSKMFKGYLCLKLYSDFLGAKIINCSSCTFIDAFDRSTIQSVFEDQNSLI